MTKHRTRLIRVTDSTWDIRAIPSGKIGFVRRCRDGRFLGRIGDRVVRDRENEHVAYRDVLDQAYRDVLTA